jgi:hypothetical protein
MLLELTEKEREFLQGLVESAHTQRLRELNHTATVDYKDYLKREISLIEQLHGRLAQPVAV